MADLRCEIFVSKDGENYTKLDLLKDESIVIKYLKKDTKDLSKVSAPFSNGFSVEATEKNMQAFGFFGKTEVIRLSGSNILKCKIYVNSFLNNTGLLKIENVKYTNGKASSFNVSFNSNILSLKDRIGDDKLSDLETININWTPATMFNSIKNKQTILGVDYYTPLISNNRVWSYDADTNSEDNVHYKSGNSATSTKVINSGEVRPAVSMKSLFGLIKDKYDLQITMPLENRIEFSEAYVWCNGSNFTQNRNERLRLFNQFAVFASGTPTMTAVANLADSSILITRNATINNFCQFIFHNTFITGNENDIPCKLHLISKATGAYFYTCEFTLTQGSELNSFALPSTMFTSNQSEFYVNLECDKNVSWASFEIRFVNVTLGLKGVRSINNNNISFTNFNKINLLKCIPDTKVMDFITSIIKTFNISIFDSSLNNENLDFLTIEDIENEVAVYGKRETDYTRFADLSKVDKKVLEDFTYYNFRHKESKYKSNVDFKNQFALEYGQITYPTVKPPQAKEYIIESGFSIIPPVTINGSTIQTCYGFTSDAPTFESGLFRYTPNEDELTIFYKGNPIGINNLGCQNINSSGVLVNGILGQYQKSTPFNLNNGYSFGFSILVNNNTSYSLSLYYNYYRQQTELLLNPNTLEHAISLELPPNEIYLNENIGFTPLGFRLQNDVVISETKYEIIEAEINIVNGKTKAKFLNK